MAKVSKNNRRTKNKTVKWFLFDDAGSGFSGSKTQPLTPREREVLSLVTRGPSNKSVKTLPGITTVHRSLDPLEVTKKVAKVIHRANRGPAIEQRVYGTDGRLKTVYTIDSGSDTFGSELGYAFKKNVAKARRENKKKFGTADANIRKG